MANVELMNDILKVAGVLPILASAEKQDAVPAAKALAAGGVPIVEVLLRSEDAMGNLHRIAKDAPEIIVGAGTVVTLRQAEEAVDHGAQFIVMPGFGRPVVEFCLKQNIPVIPGCVTPAELTTAVEYGLTVVKFFPVYELSGLGMLNHFSGTFPSIQYVVTGALNESNFLPLMENPNVLAAGGDWMYTQRQALERRDWEQVARNLRESVIQVQDLHNAMAIERGKVR